jgi:hypothetical protein
MIAPFDSYHYLGDYSEMQATPAPTLPPSSTEHSREIDDYPDPPKNFGSAPFGVLAVLFDKLQSERKQEKRRSLLAGWFQVCSGVRERMETY